MYSKLEFTKLTKCLQGSHDGLLKERALSDNLSNFEQKNAANVFLLLCIFEGETGLASPLCSRAFPCCWGLLGLCCSVEMHSLFECEVIYYFILVYIPCMNMRLSAVLSLYEYEVIYYFTLV